MLLRAKDFVNSPWENQINIYQNNSTYKIQGHLVYGIGHSASCRRTSLQEMLGKYQSLRGVAAYSNALGKAHLITSCRINGSNQQHAWFSRTFIFYFSCFF